MEKVLRKHLGLVDNQELFRVIMEVQERVEVNLRLYEKEPMNVEAQRLRKEGMDWLKGRLRQVVPQLGVIAQRWGFQQDECILIKFHKLCLASPQ